MPPLLRLSSGSKLPNELNDAELRRVIDQLPRFSGKTIAISGGEPAVRPGCMDLVEYAAVECGHDVDLYTNGYKFPRKFAERLVDISARTSSAVRVQVSLEGAQARTNDLIRGAGAFDRTVASLEMFRKIGLNRQTSIFVCLTKMNIDEVDDVVALARRLDVVRLHFSQWQRQGNASDTPWADIAPSTEEWVDAGARMLAEHDARLHVTGNFYGDLKNNPAGGFTLNPSIFPKHLYFYNAFPRISPDGMIFADQFWTHPDWSLGNVRDITIEQAFNTQLFADQVTALRERVDHIEECMAMTALPGPGVTEVCGPTCSDLAKI